MRLIQRALGLTDRRANSTAGPPVCHALRQSEDAGLNLMRGVLPLQQPCRSSLVVRGIQAINYLIVNAIRCSGPERARQRRCSASACLIVVRHTPVGVIRRA